MILFIVILICIIIVLYRSNSDLKKENDFIKDKLVEAKRDNSKTNNNKIWNFCPNCGKKLYSNIEEYLKDNNVKERKNTSYIVERELPIQDKTINNNSYIEEKHSDKEIKNSAILVTGAILIILSAIIFLITTWDVTYSVTKTFMLIFMLFVFLGAYHIADKILKIKQTAMAFYFIALSYLPIALLSISLFGLFGEFFSIYGLGRFMYLSVSSATISYIY